MTTDKPTTLGTPLNNLKDLPKSIITHMPFIMFRPYVHKHDGKEYAIMDYLYFYQNLDVSSPYSDGQYFDTMPVNNLLAFTANSFDKNVKLMVIKNTYYFSLSLCAKGLRFQMDISQETIDAYNAANPDNPIAGAEYLNPETEKPLFFTHECEIIIPPTPPS